MLPFDAESIRIGASRRQWLTGVANGFGMLGLATLVAESQAASPAGDSANPFEPRLPHHAPTAKHVIFLFMGGGPSHVDLFDPKPRLTADHGKALPFEKPKLARTTTENLMASPFEFRKHGASGIDVSDLLPNVAECVDDMCIVRSVVADNVNHSNACLQMHTGEQVFSRPSIGSWLLYGLGSENQNLPGFVAIGPGGQDAALWGSSFLPATYQGTRVDDLKRPIANLANRQLSPAAQRRQLDLVRSLNEQHHHERENDSRLDARIASLELAFRMQMQAPEAFDIDAESAAIQKLYGLDEPQTAKFGRQCLLARRLVERGVRTV